jgi:uncharacterized membrane protein
MAPAPNPEVVMSWLSWFFIVLGGLVSTFAAVAITAVILLVLGQAAVLLYRKLRVLHPVSSPAPAR